MRALAGTEEMKMH